MDTVLDEAEYVMDTDLHMVRVAVHILPRLYLPYLLYLLL